MLINYSRNVLELWVEGAIAALWRDSSGPPEFLQFRHRQLICSQTAADRCTRFGFIRKVTEIIKGTRPLVDTVGDSAPRQRQVRIQREYVPWDSVAYTFEETQDYLRRHAVASDKAVKNYWAQLQSANDHLLI